MLLIKGKIDEWIYSRLIDYLLLRCDVITFKLPNFNKFTVSEKAKSYFPQYEIGIQTHDESNHDFDDYKKNIKDLLNEYKKHYIKEYEDFEYFDSFFGYDAEIKVIELKEELLGPLKAIGGLYDWKYPNFPEDLCFFSKGKCFLKSVAHEKYCFIYTEDKLEKKILKKIGLKFIELPQENVPIINYNLQY